jgi:hypothetical protein
MECMFLLAMKSDLPSINIEDTFYKYSGYPHSLDELEN